MTPSEFHDWIHYHGEAYPQWEQFARSADMETASAWRGTLVGCSLDACKQATSDMLAGRIKKPFRDEDHIRAIRDQASRITAASIKPKDNRERSSLCPICQDSGFVSVLSPRTVSEAKRGLYDDFSRWLSSGVGGKPPARAKWYACALWCGCRIGTTQRQRTEEAARSDARQAGWSAMPIYDPDRHVRVTHDLLEVIDAARRLEVKHHNHNSDFDDFNADISDQVNRQLMEW